MLSKKKLLFIIFFILLFCLQSLRFITNSPLIKDSGENLKLSYNLAYMNTMGINKEINGTITPSNEREPFPIFFNALLIKSIPSLANGHTLETINSGKYVKAIKRGNVFWYGLMLMSVFLLAHQILKTKLSSNFAFAIAFAVLFYVQMIQSAGYVDYMLTEYHSSALLLFFLWATIKAFDSEKKSWFVIAGLLYAVLSLTKASYVYIGIGAILFLTAYLSFTSCSKNIKVGFLILISISSIIISAWYVRNLVQIGAWELTGRGPVVLLTRAYKNQIANHEFYGAFYAYAPRSLKKITKQLTGYSWRDREYGGKLQRLSRVFPEDIEARKRGDELGAIAYYIQATTHANNIQAYYLKMISNPTQARLLADKQIKQEAIAMIKSDIPAHLKSTLVFAWRGAWPGNTIDGRHHPGGFKPPIWKEWSPFLGLICMISLTIYALRKKETILLLLTLVPIGHFSFHALATHFIPRYSDSLVPIWIICLVFVIAGIFKKSIASIKQSQFWLSWQSHA